MVNDRPLLGISFMLGFCVLAPLGDAMAKLLGDTLPVVQLLWFRFAIQAVVLVPLCFALGLSLRMPSRVFWFTVLRSLLHMIGIWAMFTSLQYLPLADAVAIAFVMPFIMLILGKYVLKETVGPQRVWACVVGFVGTLFVIQPNFANAGWAALLPLVVAVVFALFMLVTRKIAKHTDPVSLQAVSGIIVVVLMTPLMWLMVENGVENIIAPIPHDIWWLVALLGLGGTVAHLCMTASLRYAPSATLAPMQYLEIPIATIIGLLIFREFPNALALIGITITIAAGLYVIFREQAIQRQSKAPR